MKIVVVGEKGLLGEACMRVFAQKNRAELEGVAREDLDLNALEAVKKYTTALDYDVLIYTAAISGLEDCLARPDEARNVNSLAPELMAKVTKRKGAKMIYISTDYVFDGIEKIRPDEDSVANPVNVYGKSKLEGEQRVLTADDTALVCRVSWLFGRGRAAFVDQVIDTHRSGDPGFYIGDKYSVPNHCDDLVLALWKIILRDHTQKVSGILHLTNPAEPETWYSYAEKVLTQANHLGLLKSYTQDIHNTGLDDAHFFKEQRPRHTAMISRRLQNELGIQMRDWQAGLVDFLQWKLDHDLTNDEI